MGLTRVSGDVIQSTINVGVVTATRIDGDVSGNVNSTGVSTFTTLKVGTGVTISSGIVTAITFSGNLSGNATGLSGTPNITVGSITASSAIISGNVSVAGTVTYEDTTNVDSIGVITARSGIRVNAGGVVIVGSATSTGTESQPLQVTGGAYVSGNLGIGNSNPSSSLDISGGQIRVRSSGTYSEPTDNAGIIGYDNISGNLTISARSSGGSTALAFRTSNSGTGAERFRIDSSGRVTAPFQPAFYILHGSGGGINQQDTTVIPNAPQINRGSAYSTSTGRYTCPVAGLYQVFFGTIKSDNGVAPDGRVSRFRIRKNGAAVSTELRLSEGGGYGESASMVCLVECVANDFIDVYITDIGGWYGNTYTHFGGFLIG